MEINKLKECLSLVDSDTLHQFIADDSIGCFLELLSKANIQIPELESLFKKNIIYKYNHNYLITRNGK